MVVVDHQDGVRIGALHLLAQRHHGGAALLHVLLILLVLRRPREQLQVRMRRGDGSDQGHRHLL